jgi:hypothetical protein
MDDIYYFNSPSELTATARRRAPLKTKSKPTRRRHEKIENMYSQYVCVAQFDERSFCPTGPSTLFPAGSISYAASRTETPRPLTGPENCHDAENNDDYHDHDSDDDNGGVPIPPPNDDEVMPGRAHTSYDLNGTTQQAGSSDSGRTIIGRPFNSRSETREMWDEEVSRRTRFALEGDSSHEMYHSDVTVPPLLPQSLSAPPNSELDLNLPITLPDPILRMESSSSRPFRDTIPQLSVGAADNYLPAARDFESARSIPEQHRTHSIQVDEDALPVDDPQRSYDFAEFMDTWRLRSLRDKRLNVSGPAEHLSSSSYQVPELVTRKDFPSGNVDMQGISWQHIGCNREQATFARSSLHPSGSGMHLSEEQMSVSPSNTGHDERHYKFRSFAFQHKAKFSHYQLRNALTASSRNDVFFANGSKVMRASLACPNQSEVAMDLSRPTKCSSGFRITCLSASRRASFSSYRSDAVLLAGGFEGEFAMLDLNDINEPQTEGMVTHAYNGLVTHIENYADRGSGQLRAAFCANDSKVRLMDVRRLQFTDAFSYNTAINCSATSADGRLRALVGDSCDTIITDAEKGTPLVTLREQTDHGFACAWSQDGRNMATGAQDGKVVVWDTRSWSEPLRVLDTSMSCARSLKFTDDGALVVAENDDVVRVYDGGDFAAWQEIRFFGSIAGLALIDGGEEMVVANVDKTVGGLLSFERNAARATFSGSLQHSGFARVEGSLRGRRGRAVQQWEATDDMMV